MVSEFLKNEMSDDELTDVVGGIDLSFLMKETSEHVVREGETLSSIAGIYGCSWIQIYAMNMDKISNPNYVQAGWTLTVPGHAPTMETVQVSRINSANA